MTYTFWTLPCPKGLCYTCRQIHMLDDTATLVHKLYPAVMYELFGVGIRPYRCMEDLLLDRER